jgi:hypothetical protein
MLKILLAGAAVALVGGGSASAQLLPKETTTVCVDVNGNLKAPDCRSPEASRL